MARWFGRSAVAAVVGTWMCYGARWRQAPVIGAVAAISIFLTWKFSRGGGSGDDDEERKADDEPNVDDSDKAALEDTHLEVLDQKLRLRSIIEDNSIRPEQSGNHSDSASESLKDQPRSTVHNDDRMNSIQNSDFEDSIEAIHESGDGQDVCRKRRSVDTYIVSSTKPQRARENRLHFTSTHDEDNISSRRQVQAGDSVQSRIVDAAELQTSSQIPREVGILMVVRDARGAKNVGVDTHAQRAADERRNPGRNDLRSSSPTPSGAESSVHHPRCHVAFDRSNLEEWTMPTSYLIGRRKDEDSAHPSTLKIGCGEYEQTQTTNRQSSFALDPGHEHSIDSRLVTTKVVRHERLGDEASNHSPTGYNGDVIAEQLSSAISGTFQRSETDQMRPDYVDTHHSVLTDDEGFGSTPSTGTPNLRPEQSTGSSSKSELTDRQRAYDEYLADPELSPTMRSQVLRAKTSLAKYFEDSDGE